MAAFLRLGREIKMVVPVVGVVELGRSTDPTAEKGGQIG